MVEISCFFNIYDNPHVKYVFIKYNNYCKIIINGKSIIVSNNTLINNKLLFQIYILSLLCTNDTTKVDIMIIKNKSIFGITTQLYIPSLNKKENECFYIKSKNIYGVFTEKYGNHKHFTNYASFIELDANIYRNPLLSTEPTRESSNKKIRKFEKLFNKYMNKDTPIDLIIEYYNNKTSVEYTIINKYNEYNKKIMLYMCVNRRLGYDIYKYLNKKMIMSDMN